LIITDLNGDLKADVAVTNEGSCTASVLLGRGDGTFAPKIDFGTGNIPRSIAAADLNGDGLPDLVVAAFGRNAVSILTHARSVPAAVGPSPAMSDGVELAIAPNPARDHALFSFRISRPGHARVEVLDLNGRTLGVLFNGNASVGHLTTSWQGMADDGRRLASGVYFVRLKAGKAAVTRKFIWAR
jgi:hypothetical protein